MDKPVAGLLKDLKQRGMLDETLVVWGGEFGRTPMSEQGNGRDHNPTGFSMWMAGGGVKGGQTIGATDALGLPYVVFDGVAYTPAVAQTVARLLNEAVSMLLAESAD